jgi:peptide deformylase
MPLEIAQLGQPVLRQVAREVPAADIRAPEFQRLIDDMLATLVQAHGAGLAAPQVFVSQRLFLAAVLPPAAGQETPGVEVFVNPVLTPLSDEMMPAWEGCLSFIELLVLVPRWRHVRIDYLNRHGEPKALELRQFPARVVQHELDHLDGVLTIDRAEDTRDIVKASEIEAVLAERDEEE